VTWEPVAQPPRTLLPSETERGRLLGALKAKAKARAEASGTGSSAPAALQLAPGAPGVCFSRQPLLPGGPAGFFLLLFGRFREERPTIASAADAWHCSIQRSRARRCSCVKRLVIISRRVSGRSFLSFAHKRAKNKLSAFIFAILVTLCIQNYLRRMVRRSRRSRLRSA